MQCILYYCGFINRKTNDSSATDLSAFAYKQIPLSNTKIFYFFRSSPHYFQVTVNIFPLHIHGSIVGHGNI